ncbi:MAG: protein-export chaperone SecB [Rickettsiales bacterium]|nr:protein-export chaperone SecB [Rickettsiales bacterium]|tara:strand:+ start:2158 stop:2622 length:465 start_codon:yes stop_codon:yes gene_type:complete
MANNKKNTNNNNLKFIINAQYLKDLSFENPRAPDSLKNFSSNPTFNINVDVKSKELKDHGPNIYEVELIVKGETKMEEKPMFVIESSYCGIFTIENAEKEILDRILLIECPKFLFPFIRSVIANCTREGGFPPLMLNPIDFIGMYEKKKENNKS